MNARCSGARTAVIALHRLRGATTPRVHGRALVQAALAGDVAWLPARVALIGGAGPGAVTRNVPNGPCASNEQVCVCMMSKKTRV